MIAQLARSLDMLPVFYWFTPERRFWMAAIMLTGLIGFAIGNGHTTQTAIQSVSEAYGVKAAQVHVLKKENVILKKAIMLPPSDKANGEGKPH